MARGSDQPTPITVAYGDGIGPEIMSAVLEVLEKAGARLAIETIEVGEALWRRGITSGIEPSAWESLRRTKVFLKAPITTPRGGGMKSLNVTIRKALGLFANVRPCPTYAPFIQTAHPGMDVVVIRENEEDLYGGIEHRQTEDVVQCLKLISRPGTERLVRYAFAYAERHGRHKVTCLVKDNIMKLTDGLFRQVFEEVAREYPNLETETLIVDIGTARLAARPEDFDVVVTPNLYGDIVSDVVAEVAGSVGLGASANVGAEVAMFEAIHGSAPEIAGRGIANPSGLLLAAVLMLVHVGQGDVAERVHNAWLATIEDGIHTADVYHPERSRAKVSTEGFAAAVIERLGASPATLPVVHYPASAEAIRVEPSPRHASVKVQVGLDVFVEWTGTVDELAERLSAAAPVGIRLDMITNRGQKVWPDGLPETFCVDHWRCRFVTDAGAMAPAEGVALLGALAEAGLAFVKVEGLFTFDGVPGFSMGQGQ
ncbi:isocitrate dehydrogenase [Acidimicrobium ferrooxidans DSM 10331]|uniref:Isocitrate dehydrogenase [NADP] n=1 Tax=Acidimicrobium ferrooxidans (strain DSM 10331 / JCM 15462 / NBRC 103882 / ICP) TaxID=525909 RepID=C7M298_ACIFD|nr:NADP-dependent isocitrate dehydrogenase [Acidimicrobium ferrooxidans]ACU54887.1 isocitrate dehydrogenase [Acidimicrobium ferrooxidans DSM 10331]